MRKWEGLQNEMKGAEKYEFRKESRSKHFKEEVVDLYKITCIGDYIRISAASVILDLTHT